jgi:hypothetical protein
MGTTSWNASTSKAYLALESIDYYYDAETTRDDRVLKVQLQELAYQEATDDFLSVHDNLPAAHHHHRHLCTITAHHRKVNLTKMKNDTNEAVHSKVYDRTSVEFQNIAYEVGHSFQAHQFHLASQLMAFREMFNLFSSIDSPYTGTPFLDCLAVTTRADYSRVCFYIPKSSTVSNIAGFD